MNTTTDRDPLDLIAEEFADRCRRGETPSIIEYVNHYPHLADNLRELLPAVAQIELLKRYRQSPSSPSVTTETDSPPTKLGDYRLVREIGRGGMGVVYEAVQESLGRRVALKLLPLPSRNDPTRRERFLREAQVAARLHHTNIVPVFGVGEQDGIPYFVMQYIHGCGLNDLIAGWDMTDTDGNTTEALVRPYQWKRIAAIGRDVANALQYAHEQGVLHRDVKPGNLLLDQHGTIWVADFGLAKVAEGETLTATGDLLGTILYMAPEALNGVTNPRTDVYGLGMTLYELATGLTPYQESNPAILIREICNHPPRAPRLIDPRIPKDLETIILKAIAREPSRRYGTAAELEEDLDAFVNGEPIRARRLTRLQKSWLWARRNPIVALLSTVTFVALLFAVIVGWVSYQRTTEALANETRLLKESKEANQKLADNLQLSLATFEAVFEAAGGPEPFPPGLGIGMRRGGDRSGDRGGPEGEGGRGRMNGGRDGPNGPREGPPGFPDGKRDGDGRDGPPGRPFGGGPAITGDPASMLEAVLTFYEKFAEQNATNPKLQLDAAKAYRKAGQVNSFLRRSDRAESAYARSLDMLAGLLKQFPDNPAIAREYAMTYALLPRPSLDQPERPDRLATFAEAVRISEAGQTLPHWVYLVLAELAEASHQPSLAQSARTRAQELQPPRMGIPGRGGIQDRRRP